LVLEVVFFKDFPEWLLLCFFLGLGWLGAVSMLQFRKVFHGASVTLVVLGGVLYSAGALIDFVRWPTLIDGVVGPHEIFHIFVALGATCHWLFVYSWCHHPIGNEIRFDVHVFPDGHVHARAIGERLIIDAESVTALKQILRARLLEKFHSSIRPLVRLRYFNEEFF
jgi:hypothetical protein